MDAIMSNRNCGFIYERKKDICYIKYGDAVLFVIIICISK